MKQIVILLFCIGLFKVGYTTHVSPPHVRYKIVNNTNYKLDSLIQIQSNFDDFAVYDTFALESNLQSDEITIYTFNRTKVKKYQKLLVYFNDTVFETKIFNVPDRWIAYGLNINTDSVSLDKTYYYKVRKTLSDLLIIFPLIFIIKIVVFLFFSHDYMRIVYREFLLINFLFPIFFYLSIINISIGRFAPSLILFVIIGIFSSEILLYNKRLGTKNDQAILFGVIVGNVVSIIFGGFLTLILIVFFDILFNVA